MMQAPTRDEVLAAFREAEEERRFWDANADRFRVEYPDRFVAARGGVVIADSSDLVALLEELEGRGLSPGDFFLKFISAPNRILLL